MISEPKIEARKIGQEEQPLLLIDDFIPSAEALIDFAMQKGSVRPAEGLYPGLRSPAPTNYIDVINEMYADSISSFFGLAKSQFACGESTFSVVSTPVDKLSLIQRIPHYDKPYKHELAILHYLCPGTFGGTSFYRHRKTGYEFVDEQRAEGYLRTVEAQLAEEGLRDYDGYINGSTELFERIHSVEAKFNRAAIYRCSSLHSGNISSDYEFNFNPRTSRFTVTTFLHA